MYFVFLYNAQSTKILIKLGNEIDGVEQIYQNFADVQDVVTKLCNALNADCDIPEYWFDYLSKGITFAFNEDPDWPEEMSYGVYKWNSDDGTWEAVFEVSYDPPLTLHPGDGYSVQENLNGGRREISYSIKNGTYAIKIEDSYGDGWGYGVCHKNRGFLFDDSWQQAATFDLPDPCDLGPYGWPQGFHLAEFQFDVIVDTDTDTETDTDYDTDTRIPDTDTIPIRIPIRIPSMILQSSASASSSSSTASQSDLVALASVLAIAVGILLYLKSFCSFKIASLKKHHITQVECNRT